jgi:hypothetical protein
MRVDQQDIENELGAPGARELLASTSAAHLAYTGKDGTPRVIPVGFFWTGEQFVIATATTAPKVAALSARPDAALAIDAGDTPEQARALSIRGRASVQIVDGVVPEYLAAARQAMDAEAADEFEWTAGRCTTSRLALRSRRSGCATTTSALAVCHDSCRI